MSLCVCFQLLPRGMLFASCLLRYPGFFKPYKEHFKYFPAPQSEVFIVVYCVCEIKALLLIHPCISRSDEHVEAISALFTFHSLQISTQH